MITVALPHPPLMRCILSVLLITALPMTAAEGQRGNGSDVTGPTTTGSTTASGAFVPTLTAPTPTPVPPPATVGGVPAISLVIPASLVPTVTSLTAGTAPAPIAVGGSPTPIPAEAGILVVQLAASAPQSSTAGSISTALSGQVGGSAGAPPAPAVATLLNGVAGLLLNAPPAVIADVVAAYNACIAQAADAYLAAPPPALQAIRVLLVGLVGR